MRQLSSRPAISRRRLSHRQQLRLISLSLLQAAFREREERLARAYERCIPYELTRSSAADWDKDPDEQSSASGGEQSGACGEHSNHSAVEPRRGYKGRVRRLRRQANAYRRRARLFLYDRPLRFQPRRPLLDAHGAPLWTGLRLLTMHDLRYDPALCAAYLQWIERNAPRWIADRRATPLAIQRVLNQAKQLQV